MYNHSGVESMRSKQGNEPYSHDYYDPPDTFVKSAVRVLSVLEFFYRNRQPARAMEISRELDVPVSSTKYLLTSLVESGYMTFDKGTKKYFPSILCTGFASWLSGIYPNGEAIRNLAAETQRELGETVSVTVQHENHMRALAIEMDGTRPPPAHDFRVRIPIVGSAGGLAALSTMPEEAVIDFIEMFVAKHPPHQREHLRQQLLLEVRQTRQRGYAIKEHALTTLDEPELWGVVAVPLPVSDRTPPMVLAVTGPKKRQPRREKDIAREMKEIARKYRDELEPADG